MLLPTAAFAAQRCGRVGIIPPKAHFEGRTYAQWSAAQWQWELEATDIPTSPMVDPNAGTASQPEPVDCTLGQSGRVWFLAGVTFYEPDVPVYRSCTVPAGVALFFPVIDTWLDDLNCPGQPPFTDTGAQLRASVGQLTKEIVPGSMSASVDGRAVRRLDVPNTPFQDAAGGWS